MPEGMGNVVIGLALWAEARTMEESPDYDSSDTLFLQLSKKEAMIVGVMAAVTKAAIPDEDFVQDLNDLLEKMADCVVAQKGIREADTGDEV